MELYNVLLVDDEADVLQAMKQKNRLGSAGILSGGNRRKWSGSPGNGRAASYRCGYDRY